MTLDGFCGRWLRTVGVVALLAVAWSGGLDAAPANDNFANATPLFGTTNITVSKADATSEPGEPSHAGETAPENSRRTCSRCNFAPSIHPVEIPISRGQIFRWTPEHIQILVIFDELGKPLLNQVISRWKKSFVVIRVQAEREFNLPEIAGTRDATP